MLSPENLNMLKMISMSVACGMLGLLILLAIAVINVSWKAYNEIYLQMKRRYKKPYKSTPPNLCSCCAGCLIKRDQDVGQKATLVKLPCGHFIHQVCADKLEYKVRCLYCQTTFFTYMIDWRSSEPKGGTLATSSIRTKSRMTSYEHLPRVKEEYESIRKELVKGRLEGSKLTWRITRLPWIILKYFFNYEKLVPVFDNMQFVIQQ